MPFLVLLATRRGIESRLLNVCAPVRRCRFAIPCLAISVGLLAWSSSAHAASPDPVRVSDDLVDSSTAMGVAGDGTVTVMWTTPSGPDQVIRLARISTDGTVGPPIDIVRADSRFTISNPALGVGPDGTAVVAWSDYTTNPSRVSTVRIQPDNQLGSVQIIATPGFRNQPVAGTSVVVDSQGTATVVWYRDLIDASTSVVEAVRLPALGAAEPVRVLGGAYGHLHPSIAAQADGRVLVAWSGRPQFTTIGAAGTQGAVQDLDSAPGGQTDIATASNGGAAVAWVRASDNSLHTRSVSPGGTLGSDVQLSEIGEPLGQYRLALTDSGVSTALWTDYTDLRIAHVLADGTAVPPRTVSTAPLGYCENPLGDPEPVPSQCQIELGLSVDRANSAQGTWIGTDNRIRARRIPFGAPAEGTRVLSPAGSDQTTRDPMSVTDTSGVGTTTWVDSSNGMQQLYVARSDSGVLEDEPPPDSTPPPSNQDPGGPGDPEGGAPTGSKAPVVLVGGLRNTNPRVRPFSGPKCPDELGEFTRMCKSLTAAGHPVHALEMSLGGGGRERLGSQGAVLPNAKRFASFINKDVATPTGPLPLVVAHSMGGLIAREAVSVYGARVGGVVTLGTPHTGSYAADAVTALAEAPCQAFDLGCLVIKAAANGVRDFFGRDAINDMTKNVRTAVNRVLGPIGVRTWVAAGKACRYGIPGSTGEYWLPNDGLVGVASAEGRGAHLGTTVMQLPRLDVWHNGAGPLPAPPNGFLGCSLGIGPRPNLREDATIRQRVMSAAGSLAVARVSSSRGTHSVRAGARPAADARATVPTVRTRVALSTARASRLRPGARIHAASHVSAIASRVSFSVSCDGRLVPSLRVFDADLYVYEPSAVRCPRPILVAPKALTVVIARRSRRARAIVVTRGRNIRITITARAPIRRAVLHHGKRRLRARARGRHTRRVVVRARAPARRSGIIGLRVTIGRDRYSAIVPRR